MAYKIISFQWNFLAKSTTKHIFAKISLKHFVLCSGVIHCGDCVSAGLVHANLRVLGTQVEIARENVYQRFESTS